MNTNIPAGQSIFYSPFAMVPLMEGVMKALTNIRPLFMQQSFCDGFQTRITPTVNWDREFRQKNIIAEFVDPLGDTTPIQLTNFDTAEFHFAYSKEGWTDDNFDTIAQRQIGQAFGTVDPNANQALRLIQKMAIAEQRFENRFEYDTTSIALYGGYAAQSQSHPLMKYSFGRKTAQTYADIYQDGATNILVPAANLTTTAVTAPWGEVIMPVIATDSGGSYTAGQKAWTTANVTAGTATPVKDVTSMVATSRRYGNGIQHITMSADALAVFNFDIETNYKDSASLILQVLVAQSRSITPIANNIDGLTWQRNWSFDAGSPPIPIYTYEAFYNDRITGDITRYIPNGWVIVTPEKGFGNKFHGRIKHERAGYAAMPRFVNRWMENKSALWEYEEHTSYLFTDSRINARCAWKVC